MSVVHYGQGGYIGCSMSEGAALAYWNGEKPKSKWTKKAMLAALEAYCKEAGRTINPEVLHMRKADIFARFFYRSSWHHVGKYASAVDFYSVDDDVEDEFSKRI
jgi:hypothetical protein